MKTVVCMSSKGGCGKTLVSVLLSNRLVDEGHTVGIIDADLDSPNLGDILDIGGHDEVEITTNDEFKPVQVKDGMEALSMAMYVGQDKGVRIGSGDRSQVIYDIASATKWGNDPDFIVVDLPAGSGEVFNQVIRVFKDSMVGSVIVTQPNQRYDTLRTIDLCQDGDVPVIGVVENMSGVVCPECGNEFETIGRGTIEELIEPTGEELIGEIREYDNIEDRVQELDFDDDVDEFLTTAVERIEGMKSGVSFVEKVKDKMQMAGRELASKVVAGMINYVKKNPNVLGELRGKHNYTDEQIVLLNIISEDGAKSYLEDMFVLRKEGLKVIHKKGVTPDLYARLTLKGLAKMIWTDASPLDEWAKGRVKLRGVKSTQKGIKFFDEVMKSMLKGVRDTNVGKVLKGMI